MTNERDDLTERINAALADAGGLDEDELAFLRAAAYRTFARIDKWERLEPDETGEGERGGEEGGQVHAGPP